MSVPTNLRDDWAAFASGVEARLQAGARAYGDRSLVEAPPALAGEMEQELLDLAGWGFILWRRLRALREQLPAPPTSEHEPIGREGFTRMRGRR